MTNLEKIKNTLPDIVDYRGKKFTKVSYSQSVWRTSKFPTRSKEIIWEDSKGNQIYLFEDNIEYQPYQGFSFRGYKG